MAIGIGSNFDYKGKLSNFDRDSFSTIADLAAYDENNIDEGHISYCVEDGKHYTFNSTNSVDSQSGKWRELSTGGGSIEFETEDIDFTGIFDSEVNDE